MNITEARIDHLSDLARLSLPGGEKEEIAGSWSGFWTTWRCWTAWTPPARSR